MRDTIYSTERYEDAQRAVDHLADNGFPVERVAIVGVDLRLVEQVTGRTDLWRATASGAGAGLVFGFLTGLLFGAWFAHDGTSLLAVLLYWTVLGTLIGALIGFGAQALSGDRSFRSVSGFQAQRFEVQADDDVAERARMLLGDLRSTPPRGEPLPPPGRSATG